MKGIAAQNVTKTFGNHTALNDVSLNFEPNKIYGLLGRNGAGKTTLLNIISNRLFRDSGAVLINNVCIHPFKDSLPNIYMMSEKTYYPESMKVKDAFKWVKVYYDKKFDADYAFTLSEAFELNINNRVKKLSTGYTSIFKIIIALSLNIDFILLDEPVLGLDAHHRDLFYKQLLESYTENPRTFVISSHLIDEIASVIEHVVIIHHGEVLRDEPIDSLLSSGYSVTGPASDIDAFVAGKKVIGSTSLGTVKSVQVLDTLDTTTIPNTIDYSSIDLQQLFIQLTNEQED